MENKFWSVLAFKLPCNIGKVLTRIDALTLLLVHGLGGFFVCSQIPCNTRRDVVKRLVY